MKTLQQNIIMVKNTKFDLDLEYGQIREKRIEKLLKESNEHCMLVFRVSRLKKIVNKYKKTHTKNIGDYRASKCVVIPIKELFTEDCYKL
jgi:hypothetical protein